MTPLSTGNPVAPPTPVGARRHQKVLMVQTPEGILFPLLVANPLIRFLALAIDLACISVICVILNRLLSFARLVNADLGAALGMVAAFLISIGYPMALEWFWRGRTVGKKVLRLQVMDEQGLRLRFSQVAVRNILRFVDQLPFFYLVGGLSCLFSSRGQRLGDIAANTIVVHHPRIHEPDLDQLLPDKYNSFRHYPHLAARLRQRILPREAGVALESLVRRAELDADARLRLFTRVRRHLERKVAFPPEATEGLSDEKYVRNVCDILFR